MKDTVLRFGYKSLLSIAYVICLLQWTWAMILYLPLLTNITVLTDLTTPDTSAQSAPIAFPALPEPVSIILAGVITVAAIMATIIILVKLPKTINTTSERVIHSVARSAVPIVTHHAPLPIRQKRQIEVRVSYAVQIGLVVLPLIISLFSPSTDALPRQIAIIFSCTLAAASGTLFTILFLARTTLRTRSRASRESR